MIQNGHVFQSGDKKLLTFGKYVSITLTVLTLITFVFAMIAVPISGANAPQNNRFSFPYLNTFDQYPKDFIWQYFALALLVIFFVFISVAKQNTKREQKLFASLSHSFALISTTILFFVYYTQVMVVPSSLLKGQTDGLAILIQYNPHGLFIALEELGYIMMSLSLFFLSFVSKRRNAKYKPIKVTLIASFILTTISFVFVAAVFGLEKQDRFEVLVISIDWLTLIIIGTMFFRLYKNEEKNA